MVTVNCTLKLSKRLPFSTTDALLPTTNSLGAWCANNFSIGRYPYVLLTNEQTMLSVIIPLKDSSTFWPRFVISLQQLLIALGVPDKAVDFELRHYKECQLSRDTSRRTLGHMNEFVFQTLFLAQRNPKVSLHEIDLELSELLCGPRNYIKPKDAVRQLLAAAASNQQT